ncbi:MAG: hypothetical protein ACREA0_13680, partial [bacterium]
RSTPSRILKGCGSSAGLRSWPSNPRNGVDLVGCRWYLGSRLVARPGPEPRTTPDVMGLDLL